MLPDADPSRNTPAVVVRRAQPDEAAALTEIAYAAKAHWGYPTEWLELWRDELTVTEASVREGEVYAAAADGELVGMVALVHDRDAWELDAMWVRPSHIRRGIGRGLFEHAVAVVRRHGGRSLRIVADPHAEDFYKRLGARTVGTVASRPGGRELPEMWLEW